jgi:pyridoxamine 5'-phosphate oxidase
MRLFFGHWPLRGVTGRVLFSLSRWMMISVTGRRRKIRRRDIFFHLTPSFSSSAMGDFPPLDEASVDPRPLPLFSAWFDAAVQAQLPEPNAMTLATASADGAPSARIVLLRGFSDKGFEFFTNYQSRKGDELAANPRAALVLFWAPFHRQIRIEGRVEKVSSQESDDYFNKRPVGHRLGALVSAQSRIISGRPFLEARMRELVRDFEGKEVPRPTHWGGYRVVHDVIEFWQGRPNRLHDRLRYRRADGDAWIIERLAP